MRKITKKEVENYFRKPKHWPLLAIIIVAAIGLLVSVYLIFSYGSTCQDETCFSEALVKCKRTIYLKDSPETITQYRILGKKGKACEINVKMMQIKQGSIELISLEGKEMVCQIPLNTYTQPEENIKMCHGLLKESIQEIMIQRMHSELVENIGQISEEITKVL